MKKHIFLYYVVLITIGVSITGILISGFAQNIYKAEVQDNLKNITLLLDRQLLNDRRTNTSVDYARLSRSYSGDLNAAAYSVKSGINNLRITFIDFSGQVLGDSEGSAAQMENHSSRKEVQEAIQGRLGFDIRYSSTLNMNFYYVALANKETGVITRTSVPLTELEHINRTIYLYTLYGALIGLISSIFLAYRFAQSISRPVKELIMATKEIASGNYDKRVASGNFEELSQLSRNFNTMAIHIEKQISEMEDSNAKMSSVINSMPSGILAVDKNYKIILINDTIYDLFKISHRSDNHGTYMMNVIRNNQIHQMLSSTLEENISLSGEITQPSVESNILRIQTSPIKSRDILQPALGAILFVQDVTKIRRLERLRTEFVSNVSHELKTPLTSIRGFIETLRNGALEDKAIADRFLQIIELESERLSRLIDDILDLSEIESKMNDQTMSALDLNKTIEDSVSILKNAAEKKNVTISMKLEDPLTISANENRMKQLFINLIDNGIKYNVEGGSITIHGRRDVDKVIIHIADSGIGIEAASLPRIFERFYRVDKGRSRSMGGTGLGLSIVKHIVQLYHGDIKVSSTPGKGTEFTVTFPAASQSTL